MSSKKRKLKSPDAIIKTHAAAKVQTGKAVMFANLSARNLYFIIFLFSVMLYSNTLWNRFAFDDSMTFTDNRFTKSGLAGIKDHFKHDMLEGAFGERGAHLLSGGRYRPLTMSSFCAEYELMRKLRGDARSKITETNIIIGENDPYLNPMFSHGINILLFAITCLVIYYFLQMIIPAKYSLKLPVGNNSIHLSFIVAMLYAAHPVHTEAVANIKGRDELFCMLFSLLALIAAVKYVTTQKPVNLIWGVTAYFIALLSKENAITFFAIIPLTYYFFKQANAKHYFTVLGLYLIPVIIFLVLRYRFTQSGLTQNSTDILNNPFLLATGSEHWATIILTFLYYIKLLVIPHPLTHDYYYNQIPYVNFSDMRVIFSLLVNAALFIYAALNFRKKTILVYAVLFYIITFSITSNVPFTIGVIMNERFIYMSSLGFCLLIGFLLVQNTTYNKEKSAVFLVLLSLYSVKTFTRNLDWKSNFVLCKSDVRWSPNSVKIQTSLGADYSKEADKQTDTLERNRLLDSSIAHLNEAVRIYPQHSSAWLLLGIVSDKRNHNPAQQIRIYQRALEQFPEGFYDAYVNLALVYNAQNQPLPARAYLLKAEAMRPSESACKYLLAEVYAKLNQRDSVEYWLRRGITLRPATANDYHAVGIAFARGAQRFDQAAIYLRKAMELDAKNAVYYEDLGVAYGLAGNFDEAIKITENLIQLNPGYIAAYRNLSILYKQKGNIPLSRQYQDKYKQLTNSGR